MIFIHIVILYPTLLPTHTFFPSLLLQFVVKILKIKLILSICKCEIF